MTSADLIIACTLDPSLVRERFDEWRQLVDAALSVDRVPEGVRLRFSSRGGASRLARLAEAEHECCPFFTFLVTIDVEGVALDVTAPVEARPLVDVLLGIEAVQSPG